MTSPNELSDLFARWQGLLQGDGPERETVAEELVVEVVAEYEARLAQGGAPALVDLCRGCAELEGRARRRLAELARIDAGLGHTPPSPVCPPAHSPPGLPGLQLLGELGRGGMGVVYKARDTRLDRVVALKLILSGGLADAQQRARFLKEARALAALPHPNIVRLYEFDEHQGTAYYTMEYLPGDPLEAQLRQGPLPAARAAAVVEQLARGAHHAHKAGLLHRDLKPSNVLFAGDGTAKVADFGLVKVQSGDTALTGSNDVVGTPSYMSPEQASGGKEPVRAATDVWALGAILYACLTGHPPFQGPTILETIRQVLAEDPVPVRAVQPGVPRDLETICHKCLHKVPAGRYATAEELADDLRRFQAGEPIRARPVGWPEHAWSWCRRHPWRVAALALVGLLALVGGAAAWRYADERREAGERRLALSLRHEQREQNARSLLARAEFIRVELRQELARPGGALRALDRPTEWKARIEAAQELLGAARLLLSGTERDVSPGLSEDLDRLRRELDHDRADQALAAALDEAQLSRLRLEGTTIDREGFRARYDRAFRAAGFDVLGEKDLPALARRMKASALRECFVVALDDWSSAHATRWGVAPPERLLRLTCLVDDDPVRNRARVPRLWEDERELVSLAKLLLEDGERLQHLNRGCWKLVGTLLEASEADSALTEAWLARARAMHPNDHVIHLLMGIHLADKENWSAAAGCFLSVLAVRPRSATAWCNAGVAFLKQGQWQLAADALEKALACGADADAAVLNDLGLAFKKLNKPDDAIRSYRQALAVDRTHWQARSNIAVILEARGQLAEAEKELVEALRLCDGPGSPPGLFEDAGSARQARKAVYFNFGNVLTRREQYGRATEAYRKSVENDARFAPAWDNLGKVLLKDDKPKDAAEAFRRCIALDRGRIDYRLGLSRALVAGRGYAEAEKVLEDCVKDAPPKDPLLPEARRLLEEIRRHLEGGCDPLTGSGVACSPERSARRVGDPVRRHLAPGHVVGVLPVADPLLARLPREERPPLVDHRGEPDQPAARVQHGHPEPVQLTDHPAQVGLRGRDLLVELIAATALRPVQPAAGVTVRTGWVHRESRTQTLCRPLGREESEAARRSNPFAGHALGSFGVVAVDPGQNGVVRAADVFGEWWR